MRLRYTGPPEDEESSSEEERTALAAIVRAVFNEMMTSTTLPNGSSVEDIMNRLAEQLFGGRRWFIRAGAFGEDLIVNVHREPPTIAFVPPPPVPAAHHWTRVHIAHITAASEHGLTALVRYRCGRRAINVRREPCPGFDRLALIERVHAAIVLLVAVVRAVVAAWAKQPHTRFALLDLDAGHAADADPEPSAARFALLDL